MSLNLSKEEYKKAEEYRAWIETRLPIGKELLYLTQEDVRSIPISPEEILELTEKSLAAYSRKNADMPAKIGIHPLPGTFYHAMPAYAPEAFAAGIKWGSCYPENQKKYGYPQAEGLILFNDHLSGIPIAILDCIYVTEIRTAAVTYASIKKLASSDAKTFGMIGCGVEGRQHVKNIEKVLPSLKEIYVYDISKDAENCLIQELQGEVGAVIKKADSLETLVRNSEVIASATIITEQPEPKIKDEWITSGKTILLCDCHSLYEDKTVKRADKYLVDSIEQHELLKGYGYYPYGLPEIYAETGEVVGGEKQGRVTKDELIVCNNVGMAIEDMYVVRDLFDKALENGIGRKLPL
ncbi:ornithine cyclodeaminase family protein [Sinanaerobacter sp. ZZT-01]|uniref:ornithine cyclodeaminase family protein n=1 Tax=Sinanaerobacter sp. ZZT-01 TaxID=3111540 RepID=UPI002D799B88|nr:ornithine cyclodeaminase family protein [Sinanaerobacter sp. ZZT-01]WRR92438.1 ornithine cyclodeaminase family protein [Sinanaerobacter sp. ZZT-01]